MRNLAKYLIVLELLVPTIAGAQSTPWGSCLRTGFFCAQIETENKKKYEEKAGTHCDRKSLPKYCRTNEPRRSCSSKSAGQSTGFISTYFPGPNCRPK